MAVGSFLSLTRFTDEWKILYKTFRLPFRNCDMCSAFNHSFTLPVWNLRFFFASNITATAAISIRLIGTNNETSFLWSSSMLLLSFA